MLTDLVILTFFFASAGLAGYLLWDFVAENLNRWRRR